MDNAEGNTAGSLPYRTPPQVAELVFDGLDFRLLGGVSSTVLIQFEKFSSFNLKSFILSI